MLVDHMCMRLLARKSFEGAAALVLEDSVALQGAEYGNVQLIAGDHLVIVVQRGFRAPFLEFFRQVRADEGCACGRALRAGRTIVIRDIELDEEFAPYRAVARAAGFRSVTTAPLLTRDNVLIGTVSTHFVKVHVPTQIEFETLERYRVQAANHLWDLLAGEPIEVKALAMNRAIYGVVDA